MSNGNDNSTSTISAADSVINSINQLVGTTMDANLGRDNLIRQISDSAWKKDYTDKQNIKANVLLNADNFVKFIKGTDKVPGPFYKMHTKEDYNTINNYINEELKSLEKFIANGDIGSDNPAYDIYNKLKLELPKRFEITQELLALPDLIQNFDTDFKTDVKTALHNDPSTDITVLMNLLKTNLDAELETNTAEAKIYLDTYENQIGTNLKNMHRIFKDYDLASDEKVLIDIPVVGGQSIDKTVYNQTATADTVLLALNNIPDSTLTDDDKALKEHLSKIPNIDSNNMTMDVGELSSDVVTSLDSIGHHGTIDTSIVKIPEHKIKSTYNFGGNTNSKEWLSLSEDAKILRRKVYSAFNNGDWHILPKIDEKIDSQLNLIQKNNKKFEVTTNVETVKSFKSGIMDILDVDNPSGNLLNSEMLDDIITVMESAQLNGYENIFETFSKVGNADGKWNDKDAIWTIFSSWDNMNKNLIDNQGVGWGWKHGNDMKTVITGAVSDNFSKVVFNDIESDLFMLKERLQIWNIKASGGNYSYKTPNGTLHTIQGDKSNIYKMIHNKGGLSGNLDPIYIPWLGKQNQFDYNLDQGTGGLDMNSNLAQTYSSFVSNMDNVINYTVGTNSVMEGGTEHGEGWFGAAPDKGSEIQTQWNIFINHRDNPDTWEQAETALDNIILMMSQSKEDSVSEDWGEDMLNFGFGIFNNMPIFGGTGGSWTTSNVNSEALGMRVKEGIEIVKLLHTASRKIGDKTGIGGRIHKANNQNPIPGGGGGSGLIQ